MDHLWPKAGEFHAIIHGVFLLTVSGPEVNDYFPFHFIESIRARRLQPSLPTVHERSIHNPHPFNKQETASKAL